MTEIEKIAYAKSFIDKLANGVNPIDNSPIPDDDLVNNVRISRCFFYVSSVLSQVIEEKTAPKQEKKSRSKRLPFSITLDKLKNFPYSEQPLSTTKLARRISDMSPDVTAGIMNRLSYRQITQWLFDLGLIEWRRIGEGKPKKFPTEEGESFGLIWESLAKYGHAGGYILFTEAAQRFVVDNIEAISAIEVLKGKSSKIYKPQEYEALAEDESEE